jgi:hypothetical protein
MVTIKNENSKMIYSSGNKSIIADFGIGKIELFDNSREIACYDFGSLTLDDYQTLISDFFPEQVITYE